mgnify:CR=1 FL=1
MKICVLFVVLFLASPAWSATYWVSKSGLDSNACFNSASEPTLSTQSRLTIAAGITCLAGGDTLKIKAGTYAEGDFANSIPAGTSWAAATTIQAAEAGVIIQPSSGLRIVYHSTVRSNFIIWDGSGGIGTYWLVLDGLNQTSDCVKIDSGSNYVRIQQAEIKNCHNQGFLTAASNLEFLNNKVHDIIETGGSPQHPFYIGGSPTGLKINGNDIYDSFETVNGYGVQFFGEPSTGANEFKRNWIHAGSAIVCLLVGSPTDNGTVAYNICESNAAGVGFGGTIGPNFFHNTVYSSANTGIQLANANTVDIDNNLIVSSGNPGIDILATHETGSRIRNNMIYSATGTDIANADGADVTITGNLCESGTGTSDCTESGLTAAFADPATHNFSIGATNSCIDQGLNIGQPFNGPAPDCGAFETIVLLSATVENGDANTIRTTWENNVHPPLRPASGATGFSARVNAGARNVTAVTRVGDDKFYLTIDGAAVVAGQTVDFSYTGTGTATDSALIGSLWNQNLPAKTNQAVTNNVSAAGQKFNATGKWTTTGKMVVQ